MALMTLLKAGDVVELTAKGKETFPSYADEKATVVAISDVYPFVRVRFERHKKVEQWSARWFQGVKQ